MWHESRDMYICYTLSGVTLFQGPRTLYLDTTSTSFYCNTLLQHTCVCVYTTSTRVSCVAVSGGDGMCTRLAHMYLYIYTYTYTYIYTYIYIHAYIYLYICITMARGGGIYIRLLHICFYIHTYMYISLIAHVLPL